MISQFLWVIFPYLALAAFVGGHLWRYSHDQFGWSSRSSEMFEKPMLKWGVLLFHYGLLLVFIGHVMGLIVPVGFYRAVGVTDHNYHLLSLWGGAAAGIITLVGLLLLMFRRVYVKRVRSATNPMDYIAETLLLAVIVLGLTNTIGYRALGIEYEYRETIGPWFRSLFYLAPDPSLMAGAPLFFQVHALSAFLLFAVWPFSRLVHAWSIPVGYLHRARIQYRSLNYRFSSTRDRRVGK